MLIAKLTSRNGDYQYDTSCSRSQSPGSMKSGMLKSVQLRNVAIIHIVHLKH